MKENLKLEISPPIFCTYSHLQLTIRCAFIGTKNEFIKTGGKKNDGKFETRN